MNHPGDYRADHDRITARNRLWALGCALDELGYGTRIGEFGRDRTPFLYGYIHVRPEIGEKVTCVRTGPHNTWEYAVHPHGPVLGSAEDIMEPTEAHGPGSVLGKHLEDRLIRTQREGQE